MSKGHQKHGVIDQGRYKKISSKIKCTDREYYVQYISDVAQKDVKLIVKQTNSQYYRFVVHNQILMDQGV